MPLARRDWLLLTIAAAGGAPLTPVQLQKTLFLLGKELPDLVGPDFYVFEPYSYGPFDADVYVDAEALARADLVSIGQAAGQRWNDYRVTSAGADHANRLRPTGPPRATNYLQQVVDWARRLSFAELVRAIYARYPEYRENSVFRD